jgi:pimeloyl-ACP methyl ester carboxylesterase
MKQSLKRFLLIAMSLACLPSFAAAQQSPHKINIGTRNIAVYCEGKVTRAPTVILMPAPGRAASDWEKVQPAVAQFARVCSYDHASFGASDKASAYPQPMEEELDDLQAWLKASGEKRPFIFVGHSAAGIYIRRFLTKYPGQAAGLVFVDSSHEEQALQLYELHPKGGAPAEVLGQLGQYLKPGEKLTWKTTLPLIVLGRGQPTPRPAPNSTPQPNQMTEEQFATWDRIWRSNQVDLAQRSTRGEFRLAERSRHFIQRDQPEMVIQAIRDVMRGIPRRKPQGR